MSKEKSKAETMTLDIDMDTLLQVLRAELSSMPVESQELFEELLSKTTGEYADVADAYVQATFNTFAIHALEHIIAQQSKFTDETK